MEDIMLIEVLKYGIIIFIVILIIWFIVGKKLEKERINQVIKLINETFDNAHIEIGKRKPYDIILSVNDKRFALRILPVANKQIVITNHNTWIYYEGGKLSIKNRIKNIISFMDLSSEGFTEKVVLLYPRKPHMQRYINENEMVIVHNFDVVYKTRILDFRSFGAYLSDQKDREFNTK